MKIHLLRVTNERKLERHDHHHSEGTRQMEEENNYGATFALNWKANSKFSRFQM